MTSVSFDKRGFWYAIKLFGALVLIFGSWFGFQYQLELSYLEDGPDLIVVVSRPEVLYKELSGEAVIFSNQKSVLEKRDQFMETKEDFVFVNLEAMSIDLYKQGVVAKSFKILAKGKEGSFFETPSGLYKIQSKETNHFSSIGKVWMPWSMHFFGNYFIHGWPYFPDGTPVADTFSGGCIRLSSEAAKEVFKLTKIGTQLLVYAGGRGQDIEFSYFKKSLPETSNQGPGVDTPSFLAADFQTGQILLEKNKEEVRPIASITKLMTALVAIETLNRFRMLEITSEALSAPGDSAGLKEGESFKVQDLLYPLILSSSNDVANLFKDTVWGFVSFMNQKARAVGLVNTYFEDASGLSSKNVSTSQDIFRLLTFLYKHKSPIFALSGLREYQSVSSNKKVVHLWKNISWSDDERFIGGKSGTLSEGIQNMAGVFKVKFSESETRPVGIIVLGSSDKVKDVNKIIKYLEDSFVYGSVLTKSRGGFKIRKPVLEGASIYHSLFR